MNERLEHTRRVFGAFWWSLSLCKIQFESVQFLSFIVYISALSTEKSPKKVKVKVKVGFLYSAAYPMSGPARFTISQVAVDWQEPMVLQRKLRPSNCTR